MLANLVFSPFAIPRLPLGIALLKSYVEKNSNFQVKCADLNTICHNALEDDIRNKGNIEMSDQDREAFLKAVDVLKNKNEDFFNQAVYDWAGSVFIDSFNKLKKLFSGECRKALGGKGTVPWFVQQYAALLLSNKPDVVGFSIMFTDQIYCSLLIAYILKAANKNIKIIFGGNSSSSDYKIVLAYPFIDYVALNEGEITFLELLKALNGEKELEEVPNLVYRKNGAVKINGPSMVTNLNELPFPDFSDFDLNPCYCPEPVLPVLGSRGCYWRRCAFCVHYKNYFNRYRVTSIKRLVDELEHHIDNGIRYFDFVDEMIPPKRFKLLGEEIIRRQLHLNYSALAKPTADFTKDVLDVMYESGCTYIIWGVESGCQRVLDLMDKGTVVEDMSRVLRDSAHSGIKNHVFLIIGFPSETKEELKETMDFLYEIRNSIHSIHKGQFSLYKDSPVYENPEKFYITKMDTPDYSKNSTQCAIAYEVSQGIKHSELKLYSDFYTKNYLHHFTYFSENLNILRHHALLIYSNPDKLIFNVKRPGAESVPTLVQAW